MLTVRNADGESRMLVLKPFKLSHSQYNVLRILRGAGPEGLACREIGERMITRDPDITLPKPQANDEVADLAHTFEDMLRESGQYGARVRLTGPVPIANEEYSTVQDGAILNGVATVLIVLVILWMALHSGKIIFAVFVNLFIGLAVTTAVGLMMVGSLNLLSIAFAVLFVGLGVDFGIQFSVRYRSERFKNNEDLAEALESAARRSAVPLSLAAMATAAGFLCFLPTDYKGISELGKIAGAGMLIAFLTSITALPAMLKLLPPPGESEPVGYAFLAPVDEFLERHRVIIVAGTLLLVVAGLPLLYFMKFDFNPINLRNPKAESIATFLDLRKDKLHKNIMLRSQVIASLRRRMTDQGFTEFHTPTAGSACSGSQTRYRSNRARL